VVLLIWAGLTVQAREPEHPELDIRITTDRRDGLYDKGIASAADSRRGVSLLEDNITIGRE
jgi:hypothetical protein